MAHNQLVFFDRDPSLWFTHTVPRASHAFTEPTLLASRVAFSMACLTTVLSSSNPQRGEIYDKGDRANISISFNSITRVTTPEELSYLIYTALPGLLTNRTLDMSYRAAFHKSATATTLLFSFKVLGECVLHPSEVNGVRPSIKERNLGRIDCLRDLVSQEIEALRQFKEMGKPSVIKSGRDCS